MEKHMQKDLVKKNSPMIMDHWRRLGFLKPEFQVTKRDTSGEGDIISHILQRSILWFILALSIVFNFG